MTKRRVVVTGMGMITPLGNNVESNWENILQGDPAADIVEIEGAQSLRVIGAKVKEFNGNNLVGKNKSLKLMSKPTQFALAAAKQAFENSNLDSTDANSEKLGIFIGSGETGAEPHVFFPGLAVAKNQRGEIDLKRFGNPGLELIDPYFSLKTLTNAASCYISIQSNARGPNNNFVNSSTSSTQAIGEGYHAIQQGHADITIVGGYDSLINMTTFLAFQGAGLLSSKMLDPKQSCKPFDQNRDGFVLGEGAGILILEELNHAKNRQASIHGEIIGYGCSGGTHPFLDIEADEEVLASTIELTLRKAAISSDQIDFISAHGDASVIGDITETKAIKKVFGGKACQIPVNSVKSMTGFLGAASGGVELILTLLCMREGIVLPTINCRTPDIECDLDYVLSAPREKNIDISLSINRSIGGQNATLLVRKFEDKGNYYT